MLLLVRRASLRFFGLLASCALLPRAACACWRRVSRWARAVGLRRQGCGCDTGM
eukprot:COSAG02_NODE_463_length_21833_cov_11.529539_4_plen_54_part_00